MTNNARGQALVNTFRYSTVCTGTDSANGLSEVDETV